MEDINIVRKKLFDFLDLKNSKKIAIISDNDEDGITAAINGRLFFENLGKEVKVFFYDHSDRNSDSFVTPFNNFQPDKTLFFDLNENFVFDIIQDIDVVLKDFVVIDHHAGIELVNISQNYMVIKPKDFSKIEPSKYPASKMVFDLFGGREWIACIGIIGDSCHKQWSDFIKKTSEKIISKKKLFELTEICSCVVSMHEKKIYDLFDFLCKIDSPKKLFESEFTELNEDFQKLLNSETKRLETDGKFFNNVDLVFFETKKRLPSKMSNIFSARETNKTFIIYTLKQDFVKCSLRRGDFKVDCNKLANYAINGFEKSSGGGHIPASAARFPKKHFEKFKQRVVDYLEKNYSK
jgi:single-stranded DNA-specific DHH superfamily exonuclease